MTKRKDLNTVNNKLHTEKKERGKESENIKRHLVYLHIYIYNPVCDFGRACAQPTEIS